MSKSKDKPNEKEKAPKTAPKKRLAFINKKSILSFCLKSGLVLMVLIFMSGIYYYQIIKDRIDSGQVWDLPVAVYGQIIELEPNQFYSKEDVIALLEASRYRKFNILNRPGEYLVNANDIQVFRREFEFPDYPEKAFRVKIIFANNRISKIINLESGGELAVFKIDPKLITTLYSSNHEQRLFVQLKNFPDSLTKILMATEDRGFYEHHGVNLLSIGRAFYVNLTSGRVEGGSTLTQQLVKNLFLTRERTYTRKLQEFYMAILLDANYSKEKILELYLNEVYLGQDGNNAIHGFPLASQYYFGRPVNELSLDQQALLVGLLKGPMTFNPWTRPEQALKRRNVVLKIMLDQELINETIYEGLKDKPLGILPKGTVISPQPAFMQAMAQELKTILPPSEIAKLSGSKIFTSYNPIIQLASEKATLASVEDLKKKSGKTDIEMAIVVLDKYTGEVRAMVGSSDPYYPGLNRAINTRRSIGSLIKPAVYLSALSNPDRFRLNTPLADNPLSVPLDKKNVWRPQNYDRKFRGSVPLIQALVKSLNIPTVNLGLAVGLPTVNRTLKALGVPESELKNMPSILLGSIDLTPLEVAQMYQTIANNGRYAKTTLIRFIIDGQHNIVYRNYPKLQQTASQQASYLVQYAMQEVAKQGTARSLNALYPSLNLAGKTGTTNDYRDSWYAGIDGQHVVIIWTGLDNNQPMKLTGSSGALAIYKNYLKQSITEPLTLRVPQGIRMVPIKSNYTWACGEGIFRYIPVWTDNPAALCQYY